MKFQTTSKILVCFSLFFSLTLAQANKEVGGSEWKLRMQSMLKDVLLLFPYAFDESKFDDPKNAKAIEASLQSLAKASGELKKHTSGVKPAEGLKIDPSFPFVADAFERELAMAQFAFNQGPTSRRQSQGYLRSALSKCTMCHSQAPLGPELKIDSFKNQLASLSNADRFTALVTTRQFDEALSQFQKTLKDAKLNQPDRILIDQNARTSLALVVRVKKDPKKALEVINDLISSEAGTAMIQIDAKGWKAALEKWAHEKPLSLKTDKALFREAKKMAAENRPNVEELAKNRDVSLLRASSLLHDLLTTFPKSPLRADSYLLLASIYDALPGFAMWDLGDEYLGACIHENPHSQMGEKCFNEYEASLRLGFTGSSGTHIPAAVMDHLLRMKQLATRKK